MSLDVHLSATRKTEVYWANITHNLGKMARYLLFFTKILKYDGQMGRYRKEIDNQKKLAEYLLDKLNKCTGGIK